MHCNLPFIFTTVIISCLSIIFHKPINRYIHIKMPIHRICNLEIFPLFVQLLSHLLCFIGCQYNRKALASHEFTLFLYIQIHVSVINVYSVYYFKSQRLSFRYHWLCWHDECVRWLFYHGTTANRFNTVAKTKWIIFTVFILHFCENIPSC